MVPQRVPVATGLFMLVASLAGRGERVFLPTPSHSRSSLVTAWLLARRVGLRALTSSRPHIAPLRFPQLRASGRLPRTAGTVASLRRRGVGSGVLLLSGRPPRDTQGLLPIPFAPERFRTGERAAAGRIATPGRLHMAGRRRAVGHLGPRGMDVSRPIHPARPAGSGTFWYPVCRAVTGTPSWRDVTLIKVASVIGFRTLARYCGESSF
jgi:hypothetical protein